MSRHGDEGHVCSEPFAGSLERPFPEAFMRNADMNRDYNDRRVNVVEETHSYEFEAERQAARQIAAEAAKTKRGK